MIKIDHLTIKNHAEYSYVNLVFSLVEGDSDYPTERERKGLMRECSEYLPVRVMDSEAEWDAYFEGIEMVVDPEPNEHGYHPVEIKRNYEVSPVEKYANNDCVVMRYLDKFDKFVFTNYIEINELTLGGLRILTDRERLEGELGYDLLVRTLKCLDLFWH